MPVTCSPKPVNSGMKAVTCLPKAEISLPMTAIC
jgi:hypothetical protein